MSTDKGAGASGWADAPLWFIQLERQNAGEWHRDNHWRIFCEDGREMDGGSMPEAFSSLAGVPYLLARVSALTDQVASLRSDARALADAVLAVDRADDDQCDAGLVDSLDDGVTKPELWGAINRFDRLLSEAVTLARRVVKDALAPEPKAKPSA